jgi:hypothetical protein
MKAFKSVAMLSALVCFTALTAPSAFARPHKVCGIHHHHRVCHWVR